MKKCLLSVLSLLMSAVLLFASVPAFALTGLNESDKESIFQYAVELLEDYLDKRQEDHDELDIIMEEFRKASEYDNKWSDPFMAYVQVLIFLAEEDYDSNELEFTITKN